MTSPSDPFHPGAIDPPQAPEQNDAAGNRAAAGAGTDLARLFQEHNASLVQLLRLRLRSDQEARDVAQEAYVRLLQLDRLGTISYLRTYLFRTALNIATDRLRHETMRKSSHRDPVFDARVDELSPDRSAAASEALCLVAATLETLPPKPRYAFLLHRFADLEVAEVAARMGVTERMVRNYIVMALVRCRQALADARDERRKTGNPT